jgi:hypothetical protein
MATCWSSSLNTRKMNLKPVLNQTSPQAHTESKLDMFGVSKKLVRYVVQKKKLKKKLFFFTQAAQSIIN